MLDVFNIIDRRWRSPPTDDLARAYIISLEENKKKLSGLRRELPQSFNDMGKRLEGLEKKIDEEIVLCRFYLEYNQRKNTCTYFKRWVFQKADERKDPKYSWQKPNDAWLYTNGRILAMVEIINNVSSIKVLLKFRNDSNIFDFMDEELNGKITDYKHFQRMDNATALEHRRKDLVEKYIGKGRKKESAKKAKAFTVSSKDLFDRKKNPNLSLSVKDVMKNKKIPKKEV